jgi:hypothetical protein
MATNTPANTPTRDPSPARSESSSDGSSHTKRKLCIHIIKGSCNFGEACRDFHPTDSMDAAAQFARLNTRTVCSFFGSVRGCNKAANCTRLHLTEIKVVPVAKPRYQGRQAPEARTPARPRGRENEHKAPHGNRRGQRSPAGSKKHNERKPHRERKSYADEPKVFTDIHRMRGKANALLKARDGAHMYAKAVGDKSAAAKANQAQQMIDELTAKIGEMSAVMDEWIEALGASVDPEGDEDDDDAASVTSQ